MRKFKDVPYLSTSVINELSDAVMIAGKALGAINEMKFPDQMSALVRNSILEGLAAALDRPNKKRSK